VQCPPSVGPAWDMTKLVVTVLRLALLAL